MLATEADISLSPSAMNQLIGGAIQEAQRRISHGVYIPYGACAKIQVLEYPEFVLSGPAGTGKSRACLQKIHHHATEFPGSRYLIVRKTRASLTESALQTFERWVLGLDHPILADGPQRRFRQIYSYSNGSEIIIGGLDKPSRIMSTEYDIIFVQEAIELDQPSWDALSTRLRNYVLPFQQLIADTNPSFPMHWLKQRSNTGITKLLESRHQDNPRLWDPQKEEWTEEGIDYIERLNNLTGVQKQRLRFGKWVQAEGVVYDEFEEENLTDKEPDPKRAIELAVDDGYVNPRAILFIQKTDTEILVFDEIYHSRHLPEVCVQEVLERCRTNKWPRPETAVCPSEAVELRERFRSANIPPQKGTHKIIEGIKFVRSLIVDGNRYRTIKVNRRCTNLINELMGGYKYPEAGTRRDDENPLDKDNHACDALRYWCWMRARQKQHKKPGVVKYA